MPQQQFWHRRGDGARPEPRRPGAPPNAPLAATESRSGPARASGSGPGGQRVPLVGDGAAPQHGMAAERFDASGRVAGARSSAAMPPCPGSDSAPARYGRPLRPASRQPPSTSTTRPPGRRRATHARSAASGSRRVQSRCRERTTSYRAGPVGESAASPTRRACARSSSGPGGARPASRRARTAPARRTRPGEGPCRGTAGPLLAVLRRGIAQGAPARLLRAEQGVAAEEVDVVELEG